MVRNAIHVRCSRWLLAGGAASLIGLLAWTCTLQVASGDAPVKIERRADLAAEFNATIRPLMAKYCLDCHSTKARKGSLDLQRFITLDDVRKNLKPWQGMIEQIEAGEMPPQGKPQPTDQEKSQLLGWIRQFLDTEARARSGDPGHVPLRRLSNAEYDATIRDLTGVDLRPTREFPADGAAGEGFTNAAEALSDISPALLAKYLNAAKEIADHAVLLPDGFRFSLSKSRRDWTDEGTARLRRFYAPLAPSDGKLNIQPYLLATVRHRKTLAASMAGNLASFDEVAAQEKLNPRYLRALWMTLSDQSSGQNSPSPLDAIRTRWITATEQDVPALVQDVTTWQTQLWRKVPVGNYIQSSWGAPPGTAYAESFSRQAPLDPAALDVIPLRVSIKPLPGQSDVLLVLAASEPGVAGPIVWQRPRLEASGKPPLLLRDYGDYGPKFEVDYSSVFSKTSKYLSAAVALANEKSMSVEQVAQQHELDPAFLKKWVEVLAVPPRKDVEVLATAAAVPLTLLEEKSPRNVQWPAISGWRKKGTDLPTVLSNSGDVALQIPGRVVAHGVSMHPLPKEFVAVIWTSPVKGAVKISARVAHAHPDCGNGVTWWVEHRRSGRATPLGRGVLDLGKAGQLPPRNLNVELGDEVVLAVDARDSNHFCDMTEVAFNVSEADQPGKVWYLAADVADTIQAGNPHPDKYGNKQTWGFARGNSGPGAKTEGLVPPASALGQWLAAASDPARTKDLPQLAEQVQQLLRGPRPKDNTADRALYDKLVAADSPLLAGVDITKFAKTSSQPVDYGLPKDRFDSAGDLQTTTDRKVEIRLPAALLLGREVVVEAKLPARSEERVVRVRAGLPDSAWHAAVLASPQGAGYRHLLAGNESFRKIFPLFICFPQVVPTDEVVTLKMFHREDEPLLRMFLTQEQARQLDTLWSEQRFISRQPVAEYDYLPQFMGYTTQDTPKAFQQFFIDRKPLFHKLAAEFEADETAAIPRQLEALFPFAAKAYRRPLVEQEQAELRTLYAAIRKKGAGHDEAFRGVLSRILIAPAFLFRVEQSPAGAAPAPVNDWELAARLSYFLWSSLPDDELRSLAASGRLRQPEVLEAQTRRMLLAPRVRSLATEFGTQWIHVRGFDELKDKNEKLFPTFDAQLRQAIYEESILFFQDLFQSDRPVLDVLMADDTFLNDTLARHYGIPGVTGSHWRKVSGLRKYGRGGILGLASVQAKQAGASRTSPVLRGNWVVETLLGEKLPKPPANVPQLPEEEGTANLSMRQLVERHAKEPSCATCHVRIDPFGFALEKYDPIGRLRDKDFGGLPIDARSKLRDGTEFEGIDGLRQYLLTSKKDVIVRLFCRRLLGYALGRSVTLSDTTLLDEMVSELNRHDGRVSAAVLAIVRSPQFRMVRGTDFPTDQ